VDDSSQPDGLPETPADLGPAIDFRPPGMKREAEPVLAAPDVPATEAATETATGAPAAAPTLEAPPSPADEPDEAAALAAATAPTTAVDSASGRGWRHTLVAGVAGGVVGALVASGVYLAFGNDSGSSQPSQVVVRGSQEIKREGDIAAILKADVPAVWRSSTTAVRTRAAPRAPASSSRPTA
jgi:hypothetical protein